MFISICGKSVAIEPLNETPSVTICTPTYNRRHFIPILAQCIKNQEYPSEKLEWIIMDDGSDPIEDIIDELRKKVDIKLYYYKLRSKITIGEKRNLMNRLASGDIIINMDDDDFYPSTRISYAVKELQKHPYKLLAGCDETLVWYTRNDDLIMEPNKLGAATYAYRRELLDYTSYNKAAALSEEKEFTKDYTIPYVVLDPKNTLIVIAHTQNSWLKRPKDNGKDLSLIKYMSVITYNLYKNALDRNTTYREGNVEKKIDVMKAIENINDKCKLISSTIDHKFDESDKYGLDNEVNVIIKGDMKRITMREVQKIIKRSEEEIAGLIKKNNILNEKFSVMLNKIRELQRNQ